MAASRYRIHEPDQPHILTCTVVGWLPVFTRPDAVAVVLDSWRFLIEHGRMILFGYVVMENHLHFIASAADLAKEVGDFKSFTARRILDLLRDRGEQSFLELLRSQKADSRDDRPQQLWVEGSHPQVIVGDAMMVRKLEYMHTNPVRRGYVEEPEHWRYSSARDYAGRGGLVPVQTDW